MRSTCRTVTLAALAAGACAGTAQAAVIDTDSVNLQTSGYDFGGSGWVAGSPVGSGEIHHHLENGQVRPHLRGTIHLNDADGTCGRMRLEYYDAEHTLLSTNYGGEVCVTDDDHHSWSVDLDPYADNEIAEVRISLQRETVAGWTTIDSGISYPTPVNENLSITEDGVDFGGPGFLFGEPAQGSWESSVGPAFGGEGVVLWRLEDGEVEPSIEGFIHRNNSSGVCARLNVRYYTEDGIFLRSAAGGSVCAADNDHDSWQARLSPYASSRIGRITVDLQTLGSNGTWNTAGSRTASIEE